MLMLKSLNRGISGVISATFILLMIILASILFITAFRSQMEMSSIVSERIEEEAKAMAIMKSVTVYMVKESPYVVLNVSNKFTEPVKITGIIIQYGDGSYDLIPSEKLKYSTFVEAVIYDHKGSKIKEWSSDDFLGFNNSFPLILGTGYTLELKIKPIKEIKIVKSAMNMGVIATSIAFTKPPPVAGNITIPSITQKYTVMYTPQFLSEGTQAILGFIPKEAFAELKDIQVLKGSHVSGGLDDIREDDDKYYVVKTSYPSGWLIGWKYRKEIIIEERAGVSLKDYAIAIQLNSDNFDFSKAKGDGSDIRFTLNDGVTKIPYWIEKWDSKNKVATVWVKIPSIPAKGKVKIYMYYGNPAASSESNIRKVFLYAEDLETDYDGDGDVDDDDMKRVGWKIVSERRGLWHITQHRSWTPTHSWYYGREGYWDYNVGTTRGYIQSPKIDITRPSNIGIMIMFHTWWEHEKYPWGDYDSMDVYISTNGRTWTRVWHRDCNEGPQRANWHREDIDVSKIVSGKNSLYIKFRFNSIDGLYNNYEGWYVDDIIVRYYVSPEPAISIGEEQAIKLITKVSITFTSINPDTPQLSIKVIPKCTISTTLKLYLWNYESKSFKLVYSTTYTPPNEKNITLPIVNEGYVSDNGEAILCIEATSTGEHTLYLDACKIKYSGGLTPAIFIEVANTRTLLLYDLYGKSWIQLPEVPKEFGVFGANTPLAFDKERLRVWIINKTHLWYYDLLSEQWKPEIALPPVASKTSILTCIGDYVYYVYETGTNKLYIAKYDIKTSTWIDLPPVTININSDYTIGTSDGKRYIYVITSGTGYLLSFDAVKSEWIMNLNRSPIAYPVGLVYDPDRNYLWLIGRGGGIHYYIINEDKWAPFLLSPPYYPLGRGNRLVYWDNKLYYVRADDTRELMVIDVSGT